MLLYAIDDTTETQLLPFLLHCHSDALVTPELTLYVSCTVHVLPGVPVHTPLLLAVNVPPGITPDVGVQALEPLLYEYPEFAVQVGYDPGQLAGQLGAAA